MTDYRPLIGLTPSLNDDESRISLSRCFIDAIVAVGGMPVILPMTGDAALLMETVERCDGVLFTGGGDIDPRAFGQDTRPCCGGISVERDAMEIPLAKLLHARHDKPVLGVCRGEQIINVALGGTVYQDIPTDCPTARLAHRQKMPARYGAHSVTIRRDTKLYSILGTESADVNSLHHQAVDQVAPELAVAALAPDGIIEAVESKTHPFYIGVQWHPEVLAATDAASQAIFRGFVQACTGN